MLIFTKTKNKLRDSLMIYNILKCVCNLASFNTKIFMSIKKEFVNTLIKIMTDNKYKIRVKDYKTVNLVVSYMKYYELVE